MYPYWKIKDGFVTSSSANLVPLPPRSENPEKEVWIAPAWSSVAGGGVHVQVLASHV